MEYVQEAMNTLPPATRIVFNLYVFDGYSHQEISE
ncbi:MAG: RNA polymerase subunit sigma-70, partial [Crocinitomicaceae bacterium]|nr:RNA polymerase subunit sigma-70 [Crocinitomicaceae bacterium]